MTPTTVMTAGVAEWCEDDIHGVRTLFMVECLRRHLSDDWGDVDAEDAALNDQSRENGNRILSAYKFPAGVRPPGEVKLWVITDAGHEIVTVLFPSEY